MKKFKLIKDVQGAYMPIKKGYTDSLDYPNLLMDDATLGICEGHGVYTWVNKNDYEIIDN